MANITVRTPSLMLPIGTWNADKPRSLTQPVVLLDDRGARGRPWRTAGTRMRRTTPNCLPVEMPWVRDFRPSPESAAVRVPDVGLFSGRGSCSSTPMLPRAEPGNVRVLGRIGGGSFGSVFKVRLRDTGTTAALKQVSLVGLSPSEQVRCHSSALRCLCGSVPVLSPSCRNPQLYAFLSVFIPRLGWAKARL